jgi:formate C-acetyltransferase
MRGLVDVYFAGGGFAVQFNVVSASTLRAAQKEPEKYKNLQIRLCGWNIYFTELDRAAQDHLIESIDKNDE